MPDPTRFERCGDHQVRNCLVCHPIAKQKKAEEIPIPEVPEFPNDGKPEESVPKIEGQVSYKLDSTANVPPQVDSPLVGAAMRYTRACSDHSQAQRDVARMREQLDSAVKYEESMRQARIAAHEEMTKLVAEAA